MKIEIKPDHQLTVQEIDQIVELYNLGFYQGQVTDPVKLDFMARCVSRMNIFIWYLLRDPTNQQILAMVSLVHNHTNSYLFDLNLDLGENICNLVVRPEARGKGLAKDVISELLETASQYLLRPQDPLVLEIKKDSPHRHLLLHLYQSMGFVQFDQTSFGLFLKKTKA